MQKERRLTDQAYWQAQQQKTIRLPQGGGQPSWYRHIERYLLPSTECSCLEIGVVPGATLLFIAKQLGYACTGIDFSDSVNSLADAFTEQEVEAEFIQQDFFTWETDRQFDFVYSCGFIEHFENYQQVLERHWSLVKPGGMLLVSVPTLPIVQRLIRFFFYTRKKMKDILDVHNIEIMSLDRLENVMEHLPQSEVIASSYISEMTVWFGPQTAGVRQWTNSFFVPLRFIEKTIRRLGISSRWFSPEAFVFVRKNKRNNSFK